MDVDEQTNRRTSVQTNERTDGRTDTRTDGPTVDELMFTLHRRRTTQSNTHARVGTYA